MDLVTFPSREVLVDNASRVPEWMSPSMVPHAAVLEGYLTGDQCEAIQIELDDLPAYQSGTCGAKTRQIASHPTLDPIEQAARSLNFVYWNYSLFAGQYSWLQTYEAGGDYHKHEDGHPGQTRKLTAVAMLSDPSTHVGGELRLITSTGDFWVPKTRGTIAVFQPWLTHEVLTVDSGVRQTINMGFWGPPFQ